jgi:membrane fusion protein, multidrug efflux system
MQLQVFVLAVLISVSVFAQEQLDVLAKDYSFQIDQPTTLMRGQLRPVDFTVLSAGIDGKLYKFDVRNGSVLKKGELIARFACSEEKYNGQIAEAKAAAARKNLEVNQKLDAYQNVSELELSMSEAELAIAEAEVLRAGAVLKECAVVAPFNATVINKMVQAHQFVQKGEPLLEIVGTDELEIEMVLPSMNVLGYKTGRRFNIHVDETDRSYSAVVDRVVNVVDPVSQTIRVIGKLLERHHGLMPGMSGAVEFTQD